MRIEGLKAAVLAAALLAPCVALAGPVNVNTADAPTLARELTGKKRDRVFAYGEYLDLLSTDA